MDKITIITNNQYRDLLTWFDLTEKKKAWFSDSMSIEDLECYSFFKYKGSIYLCNDFLPIADKSPLYNTGFQGYSPDGYWSGTLMKYSDDCESVLIGRYYQ